MPEITLGMKFNPLQFAVVREDPHIEIELFQKYSIKSPVYIGSGGCTALTLASRFPGMKQTLIEPNSAQIQLIQKKARLLRGDRKLVSTKFGVGKCDGLIEQGNFEALFRSFRQFLFEFVVTESKMKRLLGQKEGFPEWQKLFTHPYWSVAFELFFSDAVLRIMFGRAAIQHAPRESYPAYFQKVLENGLRRNDRADNYFLAHIFLGRYLPRAIPPYLSHPPRKTKFQFFEGLAQDYERYSRHDFVGLSNIFDWSSELEIKKLAGKLDRTLRPGSYVLYRQLNNQKDFTKSFGPGFRWLRSEASKLHQLDRSLFYSSLHLGVKI